MFVVVGRMFVIGMRVLVRAVLARVDMLVRLDVAGMFVRVAMLVFMGMRVDMLMLVGVLADPRVLVFVLVFMPMFVLMLVVMFVVAFHTVLLLSLP